jgi:hypothetical protein
VSLRRGIEALLQAPQPADDVLTSLRQLERKTASLQVAAAELALELQELREREESRSRAR